MPSLALLVALTPPIPLYDMLEPGPSKPFKNRCSGGGARPSEPKAAPANQGSSAAAMVELAGTILKQSKKHKIG